MEVEKGKGKLYRLQVSDQAWCKGLWEQAKKECGGAQAHRLLIRITSAKWPQSCTEFNCCVISGKCKEKKTPHAAAPA